jgi:23S rRNA pseudouridine1911/1915/1917 synthase
MNVLHEDNHLVAINKAPGEIVQGDRTGHTPLSEKLKFYLKEKYDKPGNVFAGVIHRLDRPASGVVLFAKTSKALARMNKLFRDNMVEKVYWVIVKNVPDPEEGTLVHFLKKNGKQNKSYPVPENTTDTKKAITRYKLLNSSDNYYLLEVTIETGRHHQIRCQLAAIGCPVKGDLKYGFPRSNEDGSICLHAREIGFIHPVKNEKIKITADPPDDKLWNYFVDSTKKNINRGK